MKILDALIKFGKQFGTLTGISQLGVLIAIGFIAFSFGQCGNQTELDKFRVEFTQLKKQAETATKFADSTKQDAIRLRNESKQKDSVINKLTISVEFSKKERQKLATSFTQLEHTLHTTNDTVQIIETQAAMVDNLKQQVAHADTIIQTQVNIIKEQQYKISKLDSATVIALQRGDSLQAVVDKLRSTPAPKKPVINSKIPGVIAFVAGVIIGDRLARR